MVQGNLAVIGLGHLLIASQTGLLTGVLAGIGMFVAKTRSRWFLALQLGIATTVADSLVHFRLSGTVSGESIVTGLIAVLLYLVVATVVAGLRKNKIDPGMKIK